MTFHMVAMHSRFWLLVMVFATTAELYISAQEDNRQPHVNNPAPAPEGPLGDSSDGSDGRASPTASHRAGWGVIAALLSRGWDDRVGGVAIGWAAARRWPERPAGGWGDRDGGWDDRGVSSGRWDGRSVSLPGGRPGWGSREDHRGVAGGDRLEDRGSVGGGRRDERFPTGEGRLGDRGLAGDGRWDERRVGPIEGSRWDEWNPTAYGRQDERNHEGSGRWYESGIVGGGRGDERSVGSAGVGRPDRNPVVGGRPDDRNPAGSGRWYESGIVGGGRGNNRQPIRDNRVEEHGVGSGGRWDGRGGVGDGRGGIWVRSQPLGWHNGHVATRLPLHEGSAGPGSLNEHGRTEDRQLNSESSTRDSAPKPSGKPAQL